MNETWITQNDGFEKRYLLSNCAYSMGTLPETNSSPLKMDGWNTSLSYWVSAYFQGRWLLVSGRVSSVFKYHALYTWQTLGSKHEKVTSKHEKVTPKGVSSLQKNTTFKATFRSQFGPEIVKS